MKLSLMMYLHSKIKLSRGFLLEMFLLYFPQGIGLLNMHCQPIANACMLYSDIVTIEVIIGA